VSLLTDRYIFAERAEREKIFSPPAFIVECRVGKSKTRMWARIFRNQVTRQWQKLKIVLLDERRRTANGGCWAPWLRDPFL
jgi:hypothetical protein